MNRGHREDIPLSMHGSVVSTLLLESMEPSFGLNAKDEVVVVVSTLKKLVKTVQTNFNI